MDDHRNHDVAEQALRARLRAVQSLRRTICSWEAIIEQNRELAECAESRALALARIAAAEAYRNIDETRLSMLEAEFSEAALFDRLIRHEP
jgi:hypothetical protein